MEDFKRTIRRTVIVNGKQVSIDVKIRFDDRCNNGHQSFSITGTLYNAVVTTESPQDRYIDCCGCIHDDIKKHFPELKPFIKWHNTSTDGPMHYIANTVYHAENGDLDYARRSAVWPEATLEQLKDKEALTSRLPQLIEDFLSSMEQVKTLEL